MTNRGLPPLFGLPWEREDREARVQGTGPAIPFDAGEASLDQLRRDLEDAIRQMNPPEYERRSSGSEWVGTVALREFVDLVIIRMLDELVSWRPATEYHLARLRSWGQ